MAAGSPAGRFEGQHHLPDRGRALSRRISFETTVVRRVRPVTAAGQSPVPGIRRGDAAPAASRIRTCRTVRGGEPPPTCPGPPVAKNEPTLTAPPGPRLASGPSGPRLRVVSAAALPSPIPGPAPDATSISIRACPLALATLTLLSAPSAGMARAEDKKDDFPEHAKVLEGYDKVASPTKADGTAEKPLWTLYTRTKDGQMFAELPSGFASQDYFVALTVASGDDVRRTSGRRVVREVQAVRQSAGGDRPERRRADTKRKRRRPPSSGCSQTAC